MVKSTVTRIWVAGLIVFVTGLFVGGISLKLMLAYGGHFTPAANGNGSDFIPTLNGFFLTMVSLMIVGFGAAVVGGVLQLVAWVGALVNTYQIPEKTWFVVLLVGGFIGLNFTSVAFAVMIAYFVAGPDSAQARQPQISATMSPVSPVSPVSPMSPMSPPAQLLPTG